MSSKKYTSKGIIISAPSGAGKTTIVQYLLQQDLDLEFSISATSRAPRGDEKHGEDYYFMDSSEFKKRIDNNEFVEWQEVYEGQYYGTLYSELDRIHAEGNIIIFDVDVFGGLNLKDKLDERALSIFIQAPSMEVLAERLNNRKTDSKEEIARRLSKAEEEMKEADKFDVIVVNDDLESSCNYAYKKVKDFIAQ